VHGIVVEINSVAQRLFSDFDALKDVHLEAHRLWTAFSDGPGDCVALTILDSIMVQISKFFLGFSENHLKTVVNLGRLETLLFRDGTTDFDRDFALAEAAELAKTYEEFERSMAPLKKYFLASAEYFQFPKAR